jgi:hypothetical protein
MSDERSFVKNLIISPAILIVYVLLSICLCIYFFNTKAPFGALLGFVHSLSCVLFIAIAALYGKPSVPPELEMEQPPFIENYIAIYIAVSLFGFIIGALLSVNLLLAFLIITVITSIWTLIRQAKEKPIYDARRTKAEYEKNAQIRNEQNQDELIRDMATRSAKHMLWLIEIESARVEEIDALKKELLELQNTHYVSADHVEEDA